MIVWWSHKIKIKAKTKTNKKTLQVYAIKCIDQKTEVRRVQTESVYVHWGCSPNPQAYGFHHPWITHGASPPITVKKLQNTVSPISFLWGDISRDKQIGFLLHIIHGLKYI